MELDINKKIEDLSFGNKKKVGIVQGLLHEPKLIILDEPTSGLDPLMQQKFFNLLKEENEKGATILFSSHILSEVQRLCSRFAIIKEGRIIKIEKMSSINDNNYKKFKLEANSKIEENYLKINGVTNLTVQGNEANFLYKGDLNPIMQKISGLSVANLSVVEPDLEEIFLHYYEKEA